MTENKELKGIQRYYHRLYQTKGSYYIEPRETCPLDVLNDRRSSAVRNSDI